ncbi:hypothetical protein Val02_06200 [Virgisporangium aliadipatigenens]|uniref:Uncharacterized protein n=1 Tax=Virgisporangium aliadipatigenens TaxID=741659 RepID=A0A8J4DMU5_9ACTN|nr:hypothetical protein Val02_06200 [Virgisporangium aliadipatigenens]
MVYDNILYGTLTMSLEPERYTCNDDALTKHQLLLRDDDPREVLSTIGSAHTGSSARRRRAAVEPAVAGPCMPPPR